MKLSPSLSMKLSLVYVNKELQTKPVPVNKKLLTVTVMANKKLLTRTVLYRLLTGCYNITSVINNVLIVKGYF